MRVVELRRLAAFRAELLAGPTATEALRRWCTARCAEAGRISAHRLPVRPLAPSTEIAGRLACGCGEAIRHRRVELRWGVEPLSIADNWYVPERLTPEMNAQLEAGDTPFGELVAPLGVVRRTASSHREPGLGPVRRSAQPPPEREGGGRSDGLRALLRQDAVLVRAASGHVLAAVSETYLQAVLEIGAR